MSILFSQSFSSMALSLKLLLVSTSVLSAAVLLKLSVPAMADFAGADVPSIYNIVVSWLRPPYLYLVINCIIITIVASSKLQTNHSKVDEVTLSPSPALPLQVTPLPVHPQPVVIFPEPIKQYEYDAVANKRETVEAVKPEVFEYTTNDVVSNGFNYYEAKVFEADKEFINVNAAVPSSKMEMNNYTEELSMERSSPSPSPISRTGSFDFSFSNEKPPVSKRIGHRRTVKAGPEGRGGKAALGVSKPKRQDTLESTWKTITEGRAMPLTRHLRKSDTWETHGGRHHNQTPENQRALKSETLKDRGSSNNSLLSPSPGSGKLKKEPSRSQDELNRRVEAFIKKFNEEMRLQRQESLNQYMEMINRGAH